MTAEVQSPEWQDNTPESPFWRCKDWVEIETKHGKTHILQCPSCAINLMPVVTRWRKITAPCDAILKRTPQ